MFDTVYESVLVFALAVILICGTIVVRQIMSEYDLQTGIHNYAKSR